jgi:4-hydroxy-3-methylbut-2-enyl diphosphate reductase IspH
VVTNQSILMFVLATECLCGGYAQGEQVDLVLVVGSTNSSNSVRLVELTHRQGTPGFLIDNPNDIARNGWTGSAWPG